VKLDPDTYKGMHSVLALKLGMRGSEEKFDGSDYHVRE
jgi:hypothetical protein